MYYSKKHWAYLNVGQSFVAVGRYFTENLM